MGKGLAIFAGIFGVFLVIGFLLVSAAISMNNEFVDIEAGIKGQYRDNENVYDKMFKAFRESAQIPEAYAADLEKVFRSTMEGRFGKDGSKAMFQMIREQNPQMSDKLYVNLQAMHEANRNEFAANQKAMSERCTIYESRRGHFPDSLIAGFMGFPKIDLDKYCTMVTSSRTEKAFDTKKDEEIKLR